MREFWDQNVRDWCRDETEVRVVFPAMFVLFSFLRLRERDSFISYNV